MLLLLTTVCAIVCCAPQDFLGPGVLGVGVTFTHSGSYHTLPVSDDTVDSVGGAYAAYQRHIDTMPFATDPALFGLSPNADIACELAAGETMFEHLLALQVCVGGCSLLYCLGLTVFWCAFALLHVRSRGLARRAA